MFSLRNRKNICDLFLLASDTLSKNLFFLFLHFHLILNKFYKLDILSVQNIEKKM